MTIPDEVTSVQVAAPTQAKRSQRSATRARRDRTQKIVSFEIPVADLQGLKKIAKEQERTISYTLRAAVRSYLCQKGTATEGGNA
jgi:K+-sensing histidine kinase KdpD